MPSEQSMIKAILKLLKSLKALTLMMLKQIQYFEDQNSGLVNEISSFAVNQLKCLRRLDFQLIQPPILDQLQYQHRAQPLTITYKVNYRIYSTLDICKGTLHKLRLSVKSLILNLSKRNSNSQRSQQLSIIKYSMGNRPIQVADLPLQIKWRINRKYLFIEIMTYLKRNTYTKFSLRLQKISDKGSLAISVYLIFLNHMNSLSLAMIFVFTFSQMNQKFCTQIIIYFGSNIVAQNPLIQYYLSIMMMLIKKNCSVLQNFIMPQQKKLAYSTQILIAFTHIKIYCPQYYNSILKLQLIYHMIWTWIMTLFQTDSMPSMNAQYTVFLK
ncbi:hypothetical protein FGO68_gene17802 [Halteria grandinella]|uniref:Transmembrane protein n=1 Tax=Halteria grandinella TaxID=5974 RepID=A0A8J8NZ20_HALGN|nr:hypothetical protein FGO68_gene17802 [Halteria grandinella]